MRLAASEQFALETCYLAASDFRELTRAALEQWNQKPAGDPCLDQRVRSSCDLYPPIPYVVPAQLFAARLARVKGLDADRPDMLNKVTRTL